RRGADGAGNGPDDPADRRVAAVERGRLHGDLWPGPGRHLPALHDRRFDGHRAPLPGGGDWVADLLPQPGRADGRGAARLGAGPACQPDAEKRPPEPGRTAPADGRAGTGQPGPAGRCPAGPLSRVEKGAAAMPPTAADTWQQALAAWAIPPEILAAAPESPW